MGKGGMKNRIVESQSGLGWNWRSFMVLSNTNHSVILPSCVPVPNSVSGELELLFTPPGA